MDFQSLSVGLLVIKKPLHFLTGLPSYEGFLLNKYIC